MRLPRLRQGVREARSTLWMAARLLRGSVPFTLPLALLLGVLPSLLRAFLFIRAQGTLLSVWEGWLGSAFTTSQPADGLVSMLAITMRQTGVVSLPSTLLSLCVSLLITPLLLSSLALGFNGFVRSDSDHAARDAVQIAWENRRNLIVVALVCMVAEWFVQMVPSIASGVLALLADMLSWIPLLGPVASVLAAVFSVLISLLTNFAVTVVFCYVWICASCEGVSGFGALVRSWQLTRNAMSATFFSLIGLNLCQWAALLAVGLLWLFAGRALSIPITALLYCFYAIGGLYTAALGAATSALYLRRPASGTTRTGNDRPDLDAMKRANID